MKSITSNLSIIILSLLAMAFTFVLGSTSSKAVSDETAAMQCIARVAKVVPMGPLPSGLPTYESVQNNYNAITAILDCAEDNQ